MPYLFTPSPPTNTIRYEWVDVRNVSHDFTRETSPRRFVFKGSKGLGTPEINLALEKLPFHQGSVLRFSTTNPRELTIPVVLHYDDLDALLISVEELQYWFDTGNEFGRSADYWKITRTDDTSRKIACYYKGGLQGNLDDGGPNWVPYIAEFVAPDPAFTDLENTLIQYTNEDLETPISVLNEGDYFAYPIWTITGPISHIHITNNTTGKSFQLTADGGITLNDNEQLFIDTRPAHLRTTRALLSQDNTDMFSKLEANSNLWWLQPGQNNIVATGAGITADTEVSLEYLHRYRGALR